jgi:hypothetical protein
MATVVPALVIMLAGIGIALVLNRRDQDPDLFDAEIGLKPYSPPTEMRYGVPENEQPS